jgi:hypothetical protein
VGDELARAVAGERRRTGTDQAQPGEIGGRLELDVFHYQVSIEHGPHGFP